MIPIMLEIGLILLLVYLPLAAGGVTEVSVALLEYVCAGLLVLWPIGILGTRQSDRRLRRKKWKRSQAIRQTLQAIRRKTVYGFQVTLVPGMATFGLLLLFVFIQLIPLPSWLVKFVSPLTYQLYSEAAVQIGETLPTGIPLSIATQATETEFYKLVAYGLLFLVLVSTVRSLSQIKRLLYVVLAVGLCEALYGFSQISQSRISGSFVNHNHFAGYLEMVIPLAFGLLLAQLDSHGSSTGKFFVRMVDEKYLKILLFLGIIVLLTVALFLSGSRGGFISFSLGMIGLCGLLSMRRLLRKWVWVILVSGVVMFGCGVLTQPEAILQRLGALTNPRQDFAFLYRLDVWRDSMRLFVDVPFLGSGLGTFAHIFRRYQTFPSEVVFMHAENDYVQLLTETGIIGFGIMIWTCTAFAISTFRAWQQQHSRWAVAVGAGGIGALLCMVIHSGGDFNLHIPSNAVLFTVIAALTYAVAHLQLSDSHVTNDNEVHTEKRVISPHERRISGSLLFFGGAVTGVVVLVGIYLSSVGRAYFASVANRLFRENIVIARNYNVDDLEATTRIEYQAIRLDPNHADYYFALGSYLYRHALSPERVFSGSGKLHLRNAETWLKQAIRRDPANPWYYYELGGVEANLGYQAIVSKLPNGREVGEGHQSFVIKYFLSALTNAPTNFFLQTHIGRWFYQNTPEEIPQFASKIRLYDEGGIPIDFADTTHNLPTFLYRLHLDFQSDAESMELASAEEDFCKRCNIQSSNCPYLLQSANDMHEIELGNDDGSPDWSVDIISLTNRVKKVICLPENLDEYTQSALKIFMSNGGDDRFDATVYIDEYLVKHYTQNVPRLTQWHEIPFDRGILEGKTYIAVYIRVIGASEKGNFLRIRGDNDMPTTHSVLNFDSVQDLSSAEGIQSGEYMIRLVLRK